MENVSTLQYFLDLKNANVPEELAIKQAFALNNTLNGLATKEELHRVEISLKQNIKYEIHNLSVEIKTEIKSIRTLGWSFFVVFVATVGAFLKFAI